MGPAGGNVEQAVGHVHLEMKAQDWRDGLEMEFKLRDLIRSPCGDCT